jgi:hypothetical protein
MRRNFSSTDLELEHYARLLKLFFTVQESIESMRRTVEVEKKSCENGSRRTIGLKFLRDVEVTKRLHHINKFESLSKALGEVITVLKLARGEIGVEHASN